MPNGPLMSAAQEYDTLRAELAQNKKFVFERPFIMIGIGNALAVSVDPFYGAVLLVPFVGMLLLSYWVTVNRMTSSSRIIAYIGVVLEGDVEWRGWEASLRQYRIWTWKNGKSPNRNVLEAERSLERLAVKGTSMFWQPILLMHYILVIVSLIVAGVLIWREPSVLNLLGAYGLAVEGTVFAMLGWENRLSKMNARVELDVVLWRGALDKVKMKKWLAEKALEEKATNKRAKEKKTAEMAASSPG